MIYLVQKPRRNDMPNSFETMQVSQQFINSFIVDLFRLLILATIFFSAIKILFLKRLRFVGIIRLYVLGFKTVTCLIAIFFVFFYNFETHKIGFNNGPMLYSTFLVGALATWDILSMVVDYFKSLEDLNS
jgi:hypothetical protein